MLSHNPYETFHLLLSLIKTFTRFTPEPELIYDEIQQFASERHHFYHFINHSFPLVQLKETMNRCLASLDPQTTKEFSSVLESIQQDLRMIIERPSEMF